MMRIVLACLFTLVLSVACQEKNTTPKQKGYARIERNAVNWLRYETPQYTLQYPSDATIDVVKTEGDGRWFNVRYALFGATIHCSYLPITYATLPLAIEDSYKLAYSHAARAADIEQQFYEDHSHNVAGIIYNITGNVATPIQFFVTDSTRHFLRGSVYYDRVMNQDSIAPVTAYLKEDVETIIKSIQWK